MIVTFTLFDAHIDLFLATFTLTDSIRDKLDSLSLTKPDSPSLAQVT